MASSRGSHLYSVLVVGCLSPGAWQTRGFLSIRSMKGAGGATACSLLECDVIVVSSRRSGTRFVIAVPGTKPATQSGHQVVVSELIIGRGHGRRAAPICDVGRDS